jgi:hypothetical protein
MLDLTNFISIITSMHHNTKVMSDQAAEHFQMGGPFSLDPSPLKGRGRRSQNSGGGDVTGDRKERPFITRIK